MPNFREKITRGWREIRANIAVEAAKWLGGSTVVGAIFKAVSQSAHRVPVDWWLFGCLLIVGVLLVIYSLYASGNAKHPAEVRALPLQEQDGDNVEAVMFFHFEAQAGDLIRDLEAAWHHWNNVGERLIHPAGQPNDVKSTDNGLLIKLINELRDFKVRYGDHVMYLKLRLPAFYSDIIRHGYPNDREYHNVLSDLKAHKAALEAAGRASLSSTSVLRRPTVISNGGLTKDALELSTDLLTFLHNLGPEPQPKYTRDEIARLPLAESRQLIESQDGDYSEACAFHDGDNRVFDLSPEGLYRGMVNRHTRLFPWYEKVRASYALSLKSRVEELHNRFAIEGFSDGDLLLPVQNFNGVSNVRLIAAKLWELAFKLEEKKYR